MPSPIGEVLQNDIFVSFFGPYNLEKIEQCLQQVALKSQKLDHMVVVKSSGWVGSTTGAVFFSIKKILYILLD